MEFTEEGYKALLAEIFLRFPSVQSQGFNGAYKPGLAAMEAFDEALGHPSRAFRSIHVAGTNGKGTVCNLLAAALSAAGLKTGLYTSPHIVDFRERARIAPGGDAPATLIPREYVYSFLTGWMPWITEHGLSFFEITTGLAFKWFADEGVDVAVIETGLGGRLDSTNILTPELCIVTTVDYDHCALLGDSLEAIAGEKAGIFKSGVPALVGESREETDPVFAEKSWMCCPLYFAGKMMPSLWYRRREILAAMDLQGPCREENLRTVLCAVDLLKAQSAFAALRDASAVISGITGAARRMDFHGRWERLSVSPQVLCDIGHNPQAIRASRRRGFRCAHHRLRRDGRQGPGRHPAPAACRRHLYPHRTGDTPRPGGGRTLRTLHLVAGKHPALLRIRFGPRGGEYGHDPGPELRKAADIHRRKHLCRIGGVGDVLTACFLIRN